MELFKEYRENNCIKSFDEFRLVYSLLISLSLKNSNSNIWIYRSVYKKAIENQNFDQLTDFYCWIFSKTANLIDLLVTDKTTSKTNQETKKNDPTFYVSTNWKFMKDLYIVLTKMVSFKIGNCSKCIYLFIFSYYIAERNHRINS